MVATFYQIMPSQMPTAADPDCLYDCQNAAKAQCDVEKEWATLHFLLTGRERSVTDQPFSPVLTISAPLSAAIFGHVFQIGEGYFFGLSDAENVKKIAAALEAFDFETALQASGWKSFSDVLTDDLPESPDAAERAAEADFLRRCFETLCRFYQKAAAENDAVLVTFD